MRKKIRNELSWGLIKILDSADVAPGHYSNCTMAYPLPTESEAPVSLGVARAVLTCRPNSHPFPERSLLLKENVKIGRSVAKSKAASDNAIFDCKVLSRHHASLWFDNGHFFLMDTKSSNGTFVNGHRLSEVSKESTPHEVCSGDIVQFGVDVMENSCSVTHGCIVATLKLYMPDGKEATASQSTIVKGPMHLEDLYLLNRFIQEAVQREFLLESKLCSLQRLVESCRGAVETSWQALVCKEHLLSRVQFLERRLAASNGSAPPNELQQLLDDKHKYEVSANEALRVAHEERLKLMNQLGSLQWSIRSSEEECSVLRSHADRVHQDLQALSGKHTALEMEMRETQEALAVAERQVSEEKQRVTDLTLQRDNRFNQRKAENSENGFKEEELDNDKSNWIIDNKAWSIDGERETSFLAEMEDGGGKTNSIKELNIKLYCLKNELWKLENHLSDKVNYNAEVTDGDVEVTPEPAQPSKDLPLTSAASASLSEALDAECNEHATSLNHQETVNQNEKKFENGIFPDNLSKDASVESKSKLLRDEIQRVHELLVAEETQLRAQREPAAEVNSLQTELMNAQTQIVKLSKELNAANELLAHSFYESYELKQAKEKLASDKEKLESSLMVKEEQCRVLAGQLSQKGEEEKCDEGSNSKYKEETEQLQSQLSKESESKANNVKEIERLNTKITDLQKQLEECPSSADIDKLKGQVKVLQKQLECKEKKAEDLDKQVTVLTDIQIALEDKLNKVTSDQIHAQSEKACKEVSDKMLMTDPDYVQPDLIASSEDNKDRHIVISSSSAAADLLWDVQERKLSGAGEPSFSSISVDLNRLTELEDELISTKDKWNRTNDARSELASELKALSEKYNRLASRSLTETLMYVVPLAAVLIYVLMYQYIS